MLHVELFVLLLGAIESVDFRTHGLVRRRAFVTLSQSGACRLFRRRFEDV